MNDIVKRLRERAGQNDECAWHEEIELEAANEIERLREALYYATDEKRTQYLTPAQRAEHQAILNAASRRALDNVATKTPNAELWGDAPLYGAASLSTDGLATKE